MVYSPLIWQTPFGRLLLDALKFQNGIAILSGSIDPSVTPTAGNRGDIYLSDLGGFFVKQDSGTTTAWMDLTVNSAVWGSITGTLSNQTDLQTALNLKANLASPTFTGTVSGITAAMVGLGNVTNNAQLKIASNLSDLASAGTARTNLGLGNVDNTSDANKPVSTATQTALNLKANLASPTFTGTVSGITKSMVGLGNVPNVDATVEGPGVNIDGQGVVIATGSLGYITVPYACTIVSVTMVSPQTGSIVVDIKKGTYSGFPTTTSICASAKPTISSAQKSTDSTLTGWTLNIAAGDILEFNVDSCTTIQKCNLVLRVIKT